MECSNTLRFSLGQEDDDPSCGQYRSHGKVDYSSHFPELDPLSSASWSASDEESPRHDTLKILAYIPNVSFTKLSVVFLLIAAFTDVAWNNLSSSPTEQPRVSLGSAAISSVTQSLSPILPFAGGLDLRRDDYWSSNQSWLQSLRGVVHTVQDAYKAPAPTPKLVRRTKTEHTMSLSTPRPFVSLSVIADMTLQDVATVFEYAVESSHPNFRERSFLTHASPAVRTVVSNLQSALAKSRGSDIGDYLQQDAAVTGVDTLKFVGAMRVFAEWRILRLVPDGYKGFSVGMSLGHKDVVQNLVKIEEAVHKYLDHQQDTHGMDTYVILRTPTLHELLSFEIEMGVHPANRLPRLTEKSAGMGLLWVRRQLAYQTHLFDNVRRTDKYTTTKDAVSAAYKEVYDRYHGWAVQKIFNYSFQASPKSNIIFRHMNPRLLQKLLSMECTGTTSASKNVQNETSFKSDNPFEQLLHHIGGEWNKFTFGVTRVFQPQKRQQARGTEESDPDNNDFVTNEMVEDAHRQIEGFLEVSYPIMDNLKSLFQELNMDDPTKV